MPNVLYIRTSGLFRQNDFTKANRTKQQIGHSQAAETEPKSPDHDRRQRLSVRIVSNFDLLCFNLKFIEPCAWPKLSFVYSHTCNACVLLDHGTRERILIYRNRHVRGAKPKNVDDIIIYSLEGWDAVVVER
jgi:hypothetical protein